MAPAICNLSKAGPYTVRDALEVVEIPGVYWDFVDKDTVQADRLFVSRDEGQLQVVTSGTYGNFGTTDTQSGKWDETQEWAVHCTTSRIDRQDRVLEAPYPSLLASEQGQGPHWKKPRVN